MKRVVNFTVIFFALVSFFSCSGRKQSSKGEMLDRILKDQVIRVATDFVGTPFSFKENGKEVGFEVELMQEIASELGVKIEWVEIPFGISNFQKQLNEGKVDLVTESITRTKERMADLDFTLSYFTSGQAILLRKNESVPDRFSISMLKGKKVGVEKNTTGAVFAFNNTAGDIKEFESSQEQIDALLNQDVYAIISDVLSTQTTSWPLWKEMKVVLKNLTQEEYCFAVKKGETGLVERINAILYKLKEDPVDGPYSKLYRKWFY